MMKQNVLNIFEKIIKSVKENGVINTIIGVGIIYIFFINPSILQNSFEKAFNNTQDDIENKHTQGLNDRIDISDKIEPLLTDLLLETNSDRVMLMEAHNGSTGLTGIPFLKLSATHEILSDSLIQDKHSQYLLKTYQDEIISTYLKTMKYLVQYKYMFINDLEKEQNKIDSYLYKRLKYSNVNSLMLVGIFNMKDGSLINIIAITSTKKNNFTTEMLATALITKVQVISGLMNYKIM